VTRLDLSKNNLVGRIPSEIGQLVGLTSINFNSNQLTGSVPSQLGLLSSSLTGSIEWEANMLSGTIPSELGSLSLLENSLNLNNNQLTGEIPSQLGLLINLSSQLMLHSNALCGDIPLQVAALSSQLEKNFTLTLGNALGTLCCVSNPTEFTCTPTAQPSVVPSPSPTVTCISGQYLDPSNNNCQYCIAGRYSIIDSLPYPTQCTLCPAGTYNSGMGSSSCTTCAEGKLSHADRTYCGACGAGEYAYNNTECVECEYGKYAPQALTDNCLTCPAGSHTINESKATTCKSCVAGTYSNISSISCTSCNIGEHSGRGASACEKCSKGWYTYEVGSSSCEACDAGRYAALTGSSNCTLCEIGKVCGKKKKKKKDDFFFLDSFQYIIWSKCSYMYI
jgi:hypothetical protein